MDQLSALQHVQVLYVVIVDCNGLPASLIMQQLSKTPTLLVLLELTTFYIMPYRAPWPRPWTPKTGTSPSFTLYHTALRGPECGLWSALQLIA